MKVVFLLGSPDISGGTNVIFEHATRLNRQGHVVTIATENFIDAIRYDWHPSACELQWNTINELEWENFDLAIATWWQSVYLLHKIKSRKYLYFVQSIESRFFSIENPDDPAFRDIDILREWCENTYRIGLQVITEAKWIQNYLLEHHNRSSFLVRNGIRKDIYLENGRAVDKRRQGHLRVLIEGPLGIFYKNVEKTLHLCLRAGVDEIWLLTSSEIAEYPGVDRLFSRVPIQQTAAIYRSCDVLVKLSYVEGMFGPPLEMFHCGGTAIVYDVTGHDEYIRHGENSLVVERDNEVQVIEWLQKLKNDPTLLESLKSGARNTARQWPDWDIAAREFHKAIETFDRTLPDMSPTFLSESSKYMFDIRERSLRNRELVRFIEREKSGGGNALPFLNHIQVYWDCGEGIQGPVIDTYKSGSWCRCSVVLSSDSKPKVLRVDPSVRIGIVEIRSLKIIGSLSGKIFACWQKGSIWNDIAVAGTACVLQMKPYPILEAYGEDPQLFLPFLPDLPDMEQITIEIEVCEMGFLEIFTRLSCFGSEKRVGETGWLKSLVSMAWKKISS